MKNRKTQDKHKKWNKSARTTDEAKERVVREDTDHNSYKNKRSKRREATVNNRKGGKQIKWATTVTHIS